MLEQIRSSIYDLQYAFKKLLVFKIIYMILTSFLFVPIISYIFNKMLMALGNNFLINEEVYKIGVSYDGLLGLALICFVSIIVLFMEYGVILIVSQKTMFDKEVLISDAWLTVIRSLPKLLSFGIIQLMLLFIVISPFIESPLSGSILNIINIPIFLTKNIHESWYRVIIYAVAFTIALYFVLRWIFVLHYIIIEGNSTRKAFKNSYILTKSSKTRILVQLLLLNVSLIALGFSLMTVLSYVTTWLNAPVVKFVLSDLLLTFSSIFAFAATMLLLPANMIYLTRLYYQLRESKGIKPEDKLELSRNKWMSFGERKAVHFFRYRRRKVFLLMLVAIYLISNFVLNYSSNSQLVYLKWNVLVAGHRGDTYQAPENSISGIRSAMDNLVDAIEIDVQMTKDGVVVLNHDYTLYRTTGDERSVHQLNFEELATLDIGKHYSDEFAGERIPTLEEVIQEVQGRTMLIIEIKPFGEKEVMARKVAALIEEYGMLEDTYIQSFDYETLQTIRSANNEIRIGQILFLAAGPLSKLDVDFYTINQSMLSDEFIRQAHRDNREVWVWTVNIERNMKEVLKYDIDGIITDYPKKVVALVGVQ